MTQEELAAEVGCTRTVITKYETKGRPPELATAIALADFFRVPVDFIVGKPVGDTEETTESARDRALLAALRSIPEKERRSYERMLLGRAALQSSP